MRGDAHAVDALLGLIETRARDWQAIVGLTWIEDLIAGDYAVGDHTGLVIAANDLAQALSPAHVPGVNGYRALFLDPAMRSLYGEDWHEVASDVVAALHTAVGSTPDDPRLIALVGELSIASETFGTLWAHYDVGPRPGTGVTHMNHPTIGPLTLRFEKLVFAGHPGLGVVLLWAEPGTPDAQALEWLATHHSVSAAESGL